MGEFETKTSLARTAPSLLLYRPPSCPGGVDALLPGVLGVVEGGLTLNKIQAETMLTVINVETGIQEIAAQGSAEKQGQGGLSLAAAGGGYASTDAAKQVDEKTRAVLAGVDMNETGLYGANFNEANLTDADLPIIAAERCEVARRRRPTTHRHRASPISTLAAALRSGCARMGTGAGPGRGSHPDAQQPPQPDQGLFCAASTESLPSISTAI